MPRNLTAEQRRLLEELSGTLSADNLAAGRGDDGSLFAKVRRVFH